MFGLCSIISLHTTGGNMTKDKKPVEKIQESVKKPEPSKVWKIEGGVLKNDSQNISVVVNSLPAPGKPKGGNKPKG